MRHLAGLGVGFKSLHLLAPAMTVDLFREEVLPFIEDGTCPQPSLYIQSEVGERDDDVGPYGKSLLFLISNAFEGDRNTPILGMERFVSTGGDTKRDYTDMEMNRLFRRSVDGEPSLVVAGQDGGPRALPAPSRTRVSTPTWTRSTPSSGASSAATGPRGPSSCATCNTETAWRGGARVRRPAT